MLTRSALEWGQIENVERVSTSRRAWNGVSVEVSDFYCQGEVLHQIPHESETRLSVILEEVGSRCEPRLRKFERCPIEHMPRHMTFAPAGVEVWGYGAHVRFVRDATLAFDVEVLSEQFGDTVTSEAIRTPRLRFADDDLWNLVRLLSKAVNDPDPSAQLYGDGLSAAISARLMAGKPVPSSGGGGLAPFQLRRVVEYLDAHLPHRVELARLAEVAGVSQAHFSRAFKASTGMAPYRWQLDARIRRAQALLIETDESLEEVAEATGFADAAHFGRIFRGLTGATPAVWRRSRRN